MIKLERRKDIAHQIWARTEDTMDNQANTLQKLIDDISGLTRKIDALEQPKSDRQQTEEELRRVRGELEASQRRYRDLYDLIPLGHCTINEDAIILESNRTASALLGVANIMLVKQPITRFILKESLDIYSRNHRYLCETGMPQTCELRMVRYDGASFWARLEAARQDTDGTSTYRLLFSDITTRKFQEDERELTTHLISLVSRPGDFRERMSDLMTSLQNWSGCEAIGIRLRTGNDYPYYEARGFTPAFVQAGSHLLTFGRNGEMLCDNAGNPCLACMCGNIIRGRFDAAKPFFTGRGSFWTNSTTALLAGTTETDCPAGTLSRCHGEGYESVALIPLHNGHHVFGVLQFNDHRPDRFTPDLITHFERMADNLALTLWQRKAEASLEKHSHDLSERIKELNCLYALSELVETSGESIEALMEGVVELLPSAWQYPPIACARITLDKRSFRTDNFKETPWRQHRPIRLQSAQVGSVEVCYLEARPDSDEGPFLRREGKLLDVVAERLGKTVERIETRQELRESEDRYRTLFREARDGIALADLATGKLLDCNQALCQMVEKTTAELIGQPQSLLHPAQALVDGLSVSYRRQSSENPELLVEDLLLSSTGKHIPVEIRAARISIGGRVCLVGIFRDITVRKQMELSAARADKLEAIGTMAAGIAHDFNNLLGAMFLYLDLAKEKADEAHNSKISGHLSRALDAFEKAKGLTEQLLTFTQNGAPARTIQSLSDFVPKVVSFALSGANVTPVFAIPQGIWLCSFDANQLSQALNNMIINARQAMPEGGAIEVSLLNIPAAEIGSNHPQGNYVRISLLDHGTGISQHHLPKIFDPFFSTRKMGSGLGLAAGYSIIRQHDGFIEVESQPGTGAAFHIYLPASPDQIPPLAAIEEEPRERHYGNGKILIMDDEELIRNALARMLETMGFRVAEAKNGKETAEAIINAINAGEPFSVAILDLTIPGGRGGEEIIEDLLKLDPDIKVIASSGYSDNHVMSRPRDYGFAASLKKPYRKQDVSIALKGLFPYAQ